MALKTAHSAKRQTLVRQRAWVASQLAYFLFAVQFLRRHKNLARLLLAALVMWFLVPSVFGIAISLLARLMFAVFFMVVQFGALFWFISRVKTTEIMPGDPYSVTFCVAPESRLLTGDLRWIRADAVRPGDILLGLDEHVPGRELHRRLITTTVEMAAQAVDDRMAVTTNRGSIIVNRKHPFLSRGRGGLIWVPAADLRIGQSVKFLSRPWESESGDSWLAGMLDGEGSIHAGKLGRQGFRASIAQRSGPEFERILRELERRYIPFSVTKHGPAGDVMIATITGGLALSLRLLGEVRPQRLLKQWSSLVDSRRPTMPHHSWATITNLESMTPGPVISLSTTSHTYIAEGFVSHNSDYWGQPNLLKMMQEWTTLLKDRGQFLEMGGEPPHGMLLTGAPGTGKTYLAKAMAGSTGIPFIGMEGSGFRGMFWGMDVMRTMQFCGKLRKLARQYGDEIDAVGASRGGQQGGIGMMGGMMGGMGGGALNRLLSEIDGFGDYSGMDKAHNRVRKFFGLSPLDLGYVLFIGATNRPEVLDSALVRPGRLGKIIQVDTPDKAGRRAIIKGYLDRVRHDESVNLETLTENLMGATPAQIKDGIITDSVRIAYFHGRDSVSQADIEAGLMEQILGLANPISDMEPEQEAQIATHEVGHAVVEYHLMKKEKIVRLSIIRRAHNLGVMMPRAITDLYALSKDEVVSDLMVCLGGMAACKVIIGKEWTGGAGDLDHVLRIIQMMVANGFFGASSYVKAALGEWADDEQQDKFKFLDDCMDATEKLLRQHVPELLAIRDRLLEVKEMSGDEVIAILDSFQPVTTESEARQ